MNSTIAISTTHIASDGKTYVVTSEADAGSGDQSAVTAGVLATLDKVLIQMKKDRPQVAIRTWSERTLRHRESGERVRITVTGDDGERVFGIPISPGDRRIVFARMDWIVERK